MPSASVAAIVGDGVSVQVEVGLGVLEGEAVRVGVWLAVGEGVKVAVWVGVDVGKGVEVDVDVPVGLPKIEPACCAEYTR